ncbi:MAG: hypothetical protein LBD94_03045 [Rickettsiales bacterium]|jgi:hypothetical protein|nr:hypothetical protein [Rickettsiales bacterium]
MTVDGGEWLAAYVRLQRIRKRDFLSVTDGVVRITHDLISIIDKSIEKLLGQGKSPVAPKGAADMFNLSKGKER